MKRILLLAALPLLITACHSGVKKTLGMERNQPDEFSVVERAPLTMPPNFDLLPPTPGAARPQEDKAGETAQGLVLGTQTAGTVSEASVAEQSLLSQAQAAETNAKAAGQSATLNAAAEAKRLQQQNIPTTSVPSPVVKNAQ
jgi:Protein of unknown function (DUF3035)